LLAELGAQVVLDATETDERGLPAPFDAAQLAADPLAELVRAYFDTIPDAFRRPDSQLYEYLRRQVAERNVQGLVLVRHVWCDHWHAQRERLKQCMALPLVEIDLGDQDQQRQRMRTRLETLVSMVR
jgi:benzoyl-CoA reductase/2-hydroxyglutaryl-CoA dehydratase subunit BcrC/BadD/HgdB